MIDRKMCKRTADAFFRTACMIDNEPTYMEFKNDMLAPFAMNLMFSCELYIKYFLCSYVDLNDNRYRRRGHDIQFLFEELEKFDVDITKKVRKNYNASFPDGKPFRELNKVLELNNNNFKDFRYIYEYTSRKAMYSTDVAALVRSFRKACDEQE